MFGFEAGCHASNSRWGWPGEKSTGSGRHLTGRVRQQIRRDDISTLFGPFGRTWVKRQREKKHRELSISVHWGEPSEAHTNDQGRALWLLCHAESRQELGTPQRLHAGFWAINWRSRQPYLRLWGGGERMRKTQWKPKNKTHRIELFSGFMCLVRVWFSVSEYISSVDTHTGLVTCGVMFQVNF